LVFKNHGEAARVPGAPHSQLIALPILPKHVVEELEGPSGIFSNKERCIFCDMICQEMEKGVRVAAKTRTFLRFLPMPRVFPLKPGSAETARNRPWNSPSNLYENLSRMLRSILNKSIQVLNAPLIICSCTPRPFKRTPTILPLAHEIIPRLTKTAGFEWGTGFYINPTAAGRSSKVLREAKWKTSNR